MKESKFKFMATGKLGGTKIKMQGEVNAQDAVIASNLCRASIEQENPGLLIERIIVRKVRR